MSVALSQDHGQPKQAHHLINKINELIYDAFGDAFDDDKCINSKEIKGLKSGLDDI